VGGAGEDGARVPAVTIIRDLLSSPKACWPRWRRAALAEADKTGDIRDDVAPGELATYCLNALTAAISLRSKAAVDRLVTITMDGLRPPGWPAAVSSNCAGTRRRANAARSSLRASLR